MLVGPPILVLIGGAILREGLLGSGVNWYVTFFLELFGDFCLFPTSVYAASSPSSLEIASSSIGS